MGTIKRLFFDSGMVLVYPKSGQWFLPLCYYDYCRDNNLNLDSDKLNNNFQIAYQYLSSQSVIEDEKKESEVFAVFYQLLFKDLIGNEHNDLIDKCVFGKTKDPFKYSFYSDVEEAIIELKSDYKLGIISDAWPTLKSVYRANRMDSYFDPFIISSIYGYTKESKKLFEIALNQIEEKKEECLFIDDSYKNCILAKSVGMNAIILNRNKYQNDRGDIKAVSNMDELIAAIS